MPTSPHGRGATFWQAIIATCGHDSIDLLANHSGMNAFLNYCERQMLDDRQWRYLGQAIGDEMAQPAQPWQVPRHEAIDRLERAARLLAEAERAMEGLAPTLLEAMGKPGETLKDYRLMVECCARSMAADPGAAIQRHHQSDLLQRGMAQRMDALLIHVTGRRHHGHHAAIAALIEVITLRSCPAINVRRWLKDTEPSA